MVATKITALAEDAAPDAAADWLTYVDVSDTSMAASGTNQKLHPNDLRVTMGKATTGAIQRSLKAKLGDVIDVRDYGALVDGGTNDVAALQAAHDALPAEGGTLFIPAGIMVLGTAQVSFTKSVILQGSGRSTGTRLQSQSATTTMISSTNLLSIRDLQAVNIHGAVTTAIAFKFTNAQEFSSIQNVYIEGWNIGIDFEDAQGIYVANLFTADCKTYHIQLRNLDNPDVGDHTFVHWYCGSAPGIYPNQTNLFYQSGGGLKMFGCKLLQSYNALVLDPNVATSDLIINGCSFELQTNRCIKLVRSGGVGAFRNVQITGNQFLGRGGAGEAPTIIELGTGIDTATIVGNLIDGSSAAGTVGIDLLAGFQGGMIAANKFWGVRTAIREQALGSKTTIGLNDYNDVRTHYECPVQFETSFSPRDFRVAKNLNGASSATRYQNYYKFFMPDYCGIDLEVSICGVVNGVGGFAYAERRMFRGDTGAISNTTVMAPVTMGAAIDVAYDVSRQDGVVFQVRRNAAGGGVNLFGRLEIIVRGLVSKITELVETNIRTGAYAWTQSGTGAFNYYVRLSGANPFLEAPELIILADVVATNGTLGALTAGQWAYGNVDSLGYSTVYVRTSGSVDPDGLADGAVIHVL